MPYYTVLSDAFVANGAVCLKGATIRVDGWPDLSKLAPADEDAERIADYYRERSSDPFLPKTPRDSHTGAATYLPAVSADPRGKWLPGLPETVTDGMPLYVVAASDGLQFGNQKKPYGAQVHFLGWPPSGLEPANDVAEKIMAYREQYSEHVGFPSCPWNAFTDSLYLPKLSEPEAEDHRPAYHGAPPPKGFTPPAWPGVTPKIPAPKYNKRGAPRFSHSGDDAA